MWTWRYDEGAKKSDPGRMSGRFWGVRLSLTGFCRQTCWHGHLTSTFETVFGPLGPGDLSWQKLHHSADLAPIHAARTTQQLLAELWTLADWPSYSPDLNLLDFSIWRVLQWKSLATTQANLNALCPSIAMDWDWLAAVHISKNRHSFHCPQ